MANVGGGNDMIYWASKANPSHAKYMVRCHICGGVTRRQDFGAEMSMH